MKSSFFSQFVKKTNGRRIHLDYASTTPVHPDVFAAMKPYFSESWANPSAIYTEGVEARRVIETHRTELARVLHVRPEDVTFTSGGTESNNGALIGLIEKLHDDGRAYADMEIITTPIEHPSILEVAHMLERRGVRVTYAPVQETGMVDIQAFEKLLSEKTVLVTIAYANSEIGVVQDIKKISRAVRKWNDAHTEHKIFIHTDASQAPLWLPCALDMLGVDMLTLDAGKCYGPKGVGVLVHRHWVPLTSWIYGGGQEVGLRSGTENTALIVGCVRAIIRAQKAWETRASHATQLRDYFFKELTKHIPEAIVNGTCEARVANNINVSLPGVDTEYAAVWLDARGIAVSTKSACGSGSNIGSPVIREISHDDSRANSTLRFTLGENSTKDEVNVTIRALRTFLDTIQFKRVQ